MQYGVWTLPLSTLPLGTPSEATPCGKLLTAGALNAFPQRLRRLRLQLSGI